MYGKYTLIGFGAGLASSYIYAKYKKKEFHEEGFGPSDGGFVVFVGTILGCCFGICIDATQHIFKEY